MKRALLVITAGLCLTTLSPASAIAGPFAAATLHPEVRAIGSVTDAQRDELSRNAGKLFEKLITEACKAQTQDAVKYEGPTAFQSSFQVLGQVAAVGLFSDPTVSKFMSDFSNHIDMQKVQKLFPPAQK